MIPLPAPFAFRVLQFPASSCAPQLNLSITRAPSFYFSVNIFGRWPGLFSSAFFLRLPSKVLLQVLARASPEISQSKCEKHRNIGSELLVWNWHELAWDMKLTKLSKIMTSHFLSIIGLLRSFKGTFPSAPGTSRAAVVPESLSWLQLDDIWFRST